MNKVPLIILTGPTGVGKTNLAIKLANCIQGEVISADSMQVYRHMDIGTAKITLSEMQGIPHHMIDILEPTQSFNVAIFREKCEECINGIIKRGKLPILVGGTGFYIQAILYHIDFNSGGGEHPSSDCITTGCPATDSSTTDSITTNSTTTNSSTTDDRPYRAYLEQLVEEKGVEHLHQILQETDPASAAAIHPNNVKRTIRALEFYHLTGKPISEHNEEERQKESAYRSCYFVLTDSRPRLYARIDARVDRMMEEGLVDEVKKLLAMGCDRELVSMQGLGYKEIASYLMGEIPLDRATYLIKRDTRHFAKRQLTWFRRERDVIWIEKEQFLQNDEKILSYMMEQLREKGIVGNGQS